jgi:hypothetical protein
MPVTQMPRAYLDNNIVSAIAKDDKAIASASTHGNDCRQAVVAGNGQSPSARIKPIRARSSLASLQCCNRPRVRRLP